MPTFPLEQLVQQFGGEIHWPSGPQNVQVSGIAPIDRAKPSEVTFLIQPEYMKFAATTEAAAVIVGRVIPDCPRPQLVHKNPYWVFAKTFQMFVPERKESQRIESGSFVDPSAKIGSRVTIYPGAYVSKNCVLGDDVTLFPGVFCGEGVTIGPESVLRANVVIEDGCKVGARVLIHGNTTIGADGFGFAPGSEDIAKIPQVGIVRIEDDVEIGAGATIDRAAMGETLISRGSKLDSSVHVAHNVRIGAHNIMCGGTFIAGSSKTGDWVIMAGRATINNHVEIADRVTVGGLAGVTKSIKEPGEYMGFPAVPAGQWRREVAHFKRIKHLEERLRKLEETLGKSSS